MLKDELRGWRMGKYTYLIPPRVFLLLGKLVPANNLTVVILFCNIGARLDRIIMIRTTWKFH